MVVLLVTLTFVAAAPPKLTVAPATKFVPVRVTTVPPVVGPLLGATLVREGRGGGRDGGAVGHAHVRRRSAPEAHRGPRDEVRPGEGDGGPARDRAAGG